MLAVSKKPNFQNLNKSENEYDKELRGEILSVYKKLGLKKGDKITKTHFIWNTFKDKETGLEERLNVELDKMVSDKILEFIPPNEYRLLVAQTV